MFPSVKLLANRTNRQFVRELKRHISKTSSVPNSDAISRRHDKLKVHLELDGNNRNSANKWSKPSRHNNIRALSTIQTQDKPPETSTPLVSKEESRQFMAIFPDIVRDLTDAGGYTDIPEVMKRLAKVLQYNVPTGKKIRGLSTVIAYKMLEKPDNLTPENIRLANVLGWCIELLQSSVLTADDIMDNSEKRRGLPCWFRNPDVGLQAINDAVLIECGLYQLLKKHFSSLPCYVPILELFRDITFKIAMGQSLDCLSMTDNKPRLDVFSLNRYLTIVKYKTAYHFQLPVTSAMFLVNIFDEELHRQAKTILLGMGEFFQIQDDFLDCFGNPEVTGKEGNDIREGKCSWLAVVALQRATPTQRKIMEEHYGRPDEESIEIIRNLYQELDLPSAYATYEEERFNIIRTHIQQISKGLPHDLFLKLLKQLHKRDC